MPLSVEISCDVCYFDPKTEVFDHVPKILEIEAKNWKVLVSNNSKDKEFVFICFDCTSWLENTMKKLGHFTDLEDKDDWVKQFQKIMRSGIIKVQDGVTQKPPIDVDEDGKLRTAKRVYVCRFGPKGLWKEWDLDSPPTDCKTSYPYKPDKNYNQYIVYHEEHEHPKLYKKFGPHPVGKNRPVAFE